MRRLSLLVEQRRVGVWLVLSGIGKFLQFVFSYFYTALFGKYERKRKQMKT